MLSPYWSKKSLMIGMVLCAMAWPAWAADDAHHALSMILFSLFALVSVGQILGQLAVYLGQPRVVGQVVAGVLVGPSVLNWVEPNITLQALAEFGAIFLMFMVGLETRVKDLLAVGKEATIVAIVGIVLPMLGGYVFGWFNDFSRLQSLFIGTAMVATSVGITAQVLKELGVLDSRYARIILGAAVIDDILGLSILGVVSSMAKGGDITVWGIAGTLAISLGFVVAVLLIGVPLINRFAPRLDRLLLSNGFGAAVSLSLGFAALSGVVGLAPIIGAFLIGMVLAEVKEAYDFENKVHALESFLAPVFFSMVGVQLPLALLASSKVLINGLILTVVAILGKWLAGISITPQQGFTVANKVGIGMVPRGEVGLIVVGIGLSTHLLTESLFAQIVVMIIATTVLAPILLRIMIKRSASSTNS